MKAILEFSLPEDTQEYEMYSRAGVYHSCLEELVRHCRDQIKYQNPPKEQAEVWEWVRSAIIEACPELW